MTDATQEQRQAVRIAYLVNQYPAISGTFIRREIHALEKLGHRVFRYGLRRPTVAVVDPIDQREETLSNYVLDLSHFALVASLVWVGLRNPLRFLRAFRLAFSFYRCGGSFFRQMIYLVEATVIRQWTDRDNISHLHAHFGTNSATVATLCRVLGGPKFSFTVHGPEEFDRPLQLGLGQKISHAEFVVGVSHFGRSQLLRWVGYADWSKVKVVRCGLDESYFHCPLSPPPEEPRLLAIGRLHEQKGMPLLIQAAAKLDREGVEFQLTIVGDGSLRPVLETLIAEHQLQSKVTLVGWRTGVQVQSHLLASRVLVMPSFAEGLPVACMESLALGRPVIATSIAGVPELIRSGVSGWLIPAGSAAALSRAMKKAIDAPLDQLVRLGATGAARVRKRHDAHHEAKKLSNLFLQLTANTHHAATTNDDNRIPTPTVTNVDKDEVVFASPS